MDLKWPRWQHALKAEKSSGRVRGVPPCQDYALSVIIFSIREKVGKTNRQKGIKKQPLEEIIDHSSKSLIPSNELLVPSGRESNEKNNTSCHGDTGHRAKQGSQKLYLKRKKKKKKTETPLPKKPLSWAEIQ